MAIMSLKLWRWRVWTERTSVAFHTKSVYLPDTVYSVSTSPGYLNLEVAINNNNNNHSIRWMHTRIILMELVCNDDLPGIAAGEHKTVCPDCIQTAVGLVPVL